MRIEAAAIGQHVVDQVKPLLDAAYVRVAALDGNPAERQNDALSIVATVGAFVTLQLTARLMMTKNAEPETALSIAITEIADRACAEFAVTMSGRR